MDFWYVKASLSKLNGSQAKCLDEWKLDIKRKLADFDCQCLWTGMHVTADQQYEPNIIIHAAFCII